MKIRSSVAGALVAGASAPIHRGTVLIVGVVVLSAAASTIPVTRDVARAQITRPNVVVIVTDDERVDVAVDVVMPHRQRIFSEGTKYTNAVATTPLCCPSRASIMSGLYAHNHGVRDNSADEAFDPERTLQATLSGAGYATAIVGKYFNLRDPVHFDRWTTFARSGDYFDGEYNIEGIRDVVPTYRTTFLRKTALDYLSDFEANDAQPWFLYLAPAAPHQPARPESKYQSATVPHLSATPAQTEDDIADKPAFLHHLMYKGNESSEALRRRQLRTMMSVDDMIKMFFARLTKLGEEDTIVVYLSDNGFFWDDHGFKPNKRLAYDPAVRIPFLLRWPGQVPAGVDERIVGNIDVAPTIYDLLDVQPTYQVDGQSVLTSQREQIYLEYSVSPDERRYPAWEALWRPSWVYIRYPGVTESGVREHYTTTDPWQLSNVYNDGIPGNSPVDEPVLDRTLDAAALCTGPTCP